MSAMTTTRQTIETRLQYHPNAYKFVFQALRYTQDHLRRNITGTPDDEESHISGQELLAGIRAFALEQFGLMTMTVFHQWGVTATEDFGRIVWELIERGEMRKTDRDQFNDFVNVYDFSEAFDGKYRIETRKVFLA